ncbi:WhiB family transcriptional regulator [Streptomyces himalayensis]|uniref:WhiB family transcriptional regulator n=1 Tax=Streptomyces himalayensis TaxID=2820085 RepID=UPI0028AC2494|nr:WhiB family transcriptional regulator [Streptomyces himalayensis]
MTAHTNTPRLLPAAPDWHGNSLCSGPEYDGQRDMWFPKQTSTDEIREAKSVCYRCPVIRECLAWAFQHGEDRGIWGGLTEWERRRIHKRRRPKTGQGAGVNAPGKRQAPAMKREPAKCGTRSGYQRHRKNGETACGACRDANADADRRLRNTGTTKAAA